MFCTLVLIGIRVDVRMEAHRFTFKIYLAVRSSATGKKPSLLALRWRFKDTSMTIKAAFD